MKIGVYLIVFGILMGTTIAELLLIGINISRTWLIISIIGLAGVKAILIAVFFQHLKDEPKSLSTLLLLPLLGATVFLAISMVSVM
jgi:heme/copper-type cytochrome/quinol oxidase subunit 4